MKIYKVTRIEEMDFGCEGRPEGTETMVSVFLEDEDGKVQIIRHSDPLLYEREIDEGTEVYLQDGTLYKRRDS